MATKTWISTSSTSFTTAANWSGGVAPANSDVLVFNSAGTANCLTDLSTTLTGVTVIVEKSYAGKIGSVSGATATYLVLDGGTLNYGVTTGQGSPQPGTLHLFNFGSTAATVNVYDSSSTSDTINYPPLLVKGTVLTVNQFGGSLGIAALPGETATVVAGRITKGDGDIAPSLYLGSGVTITALTANTGYVYSRSDQTATAVTLDGDVTYDLIGNGAHTTLTIDGGAAFYSGTGTITTLNLSGTFNRTRDGRALTISTTNLYRGCTINLNNGVASSTTRTAKNLIRCSQEDISILMPAGELY